MSAPTTRRYDGEARTPEEAYRAGLVAAEALGLSGREAERMAEEAASPSAAAGGRSGRLDPKGLFIRRFDEVVVNFGKHKGKPLRWVAENHPDYLRWLVTKKDRRIFGKEVRRIAMEALERAKRKRG